MGTTARALEVVACRVEALTEALDTGNAWKLSHTHTLRAISHTSRVGKWRRRSACSAKAAAIDMTADITRT
jgi:hypothetical protein